METPVSPNRAVKEKAVVSLVDEIQGSEVVVVTQQLGLNAEETRQLRVAFLKQNVGFKVGKNTLIKLAIKNTKLAGLESFLNGPTALAYSKDPIAAAKVAVEFAKKNEKLKVLGAVMQDQILDAQQTKALASLPSLDQLRAMIIGLISAPATKIAGVLQAPAGQLARVLAARARQSN